MGWSLAFWISSKPRVQLLTCIFWRCAVCSYRRGDIVCRPVLSNICSIFWPPWHEIPAHMLFFQENTATKGILIWAYVLLARLLYACVSLCLYKLLICSLYVCPAVCPPVWYRLTLFLPYIFTSLLFMVEWNHNQLFSLFPSSNTWNVPWHPLFQLGRGTKPGMNWLPKHFHISTV